MIKEEKLIINNKEFIKRFSDDGIYFKKVGPNDEYVDAIDLIETEFEYEETDKDIERPEEKSEESLEMNYADWHNLKRINNK